MSELKLNDLKTGTEIKATIRHCNKKLCLEDQVHNLTVSDDGYYFTGTRDELSYNWDVVNFELVKDQEEGNFLVYSEEEIDSEYLSLQALVAFIARYNKKDGWTVDGWSVDSDLTIIQKLKEQG